MPRRFSRRALLVTGLTALAGCGGRQITHGWLDVGSPVGGALNDVVITSSGPHAVGEDGVIVARRSDTWETVVSDGPTGQGNGLAGAAVTDDGRRLWMAGSSGAVGAYDAVAGEMVDYSAPEDKTSSWTDVAVAGRGGSEKIALLNSSGELLMGRAQTGTTRWGMVTKPTGGESGTAVDMAGKTTVITDSAGGVYSHTGTIAPTKQDDQGWRTIGISGTNESIQDLVVVEPNIIEVVTDAGTHYSYDGHIWHRTAVADGALHTIDRKDREMLTAGVEGSVYELTEHEWQEAETPTEATLHGCALSSGSYADVVVGSGGTILERFG